MTRTVVHRYACQVLLLVLLALISSPTMAQADRPHQDEAWTRQFDRETTFPGEWPQGTAQSPSPPPKTCGLSHLGQCLRDVAYDEVGIWTSPLRIRPRDAIWLVPFGGATAAALHYDAQAQQELGFDRSRISTSSKLSRFGSTYATFGEGAALYFVGSLTHHEHLAETGRLGAEAVIDASLLAGGIKLVTNRERPDQGNGKGGFWPHGTREYSLDSSFPSGHAASSWALARVIASQYPNTLTRVSVYAFAAAVSISRVTQRKHFPSDALVGSTFGYLVGGYVVRHHAARYKGSSSSFAPIVDPLTHTYGVRIDFSPEN